MNARHHLIISGTGRAGTTFLVQLLTVLGLDTGFEDSTSHVDGDCHAGMELDLRIPTAPYVVKSPWLCDYIDEVLSSDDVIIDHALIPMRDLYSAAESRRVVSKRASAMPEDSVPGGLWHTTSPSEQEAILAVQFYKLLYAATRHGFPITLLEFPKLAVDPEYLYEKLKTILPGIRREVFRSRFYEVSRPGLIHDFLNDGRQ
jgi:hypothetical protein